MEKYLHSNIFKLIWTELYNDLYEIYNLHSNIFKLIFNRRTEKAIQ